MSAKIVHYFEIQNKKLQITPFRPGLSCVYWFLRGWGGQGSAAEQPEKAGVRHAQHQKQKNEGKQHPNDDVHLVDREGEFIVELFLGVDEIRVVVVQQSLFSLSALGFGGGKFCLLLFQLGLPLGKIGRASCRERV